MVDYLDSDERELINEIDSFNHCNSETKQGKEMNEETGIKYKQKLTHYKMVKKKKEESLAKIDIK